MSDQRTSKLVLSYNIQQLQPVIANPYSFFTEPLDPPPYQPPSEGVQRLLMAAPEARYPDSYILYVQDDICKGVQVDVLDVANDNLQSLLSKQ